LISEEVPEIFNWFMVKDALLRQFL